MRGGKREGIIRPVGRPKGSQDTKPRLRRKSLPLPGKQDIQEFEEFNKRFYFRIKPYLSKDTRALYESLMAKHKSPLECLKFILADLMTRYKIGRIEELKARKTWGGITEEVNAIRQVAELIDRIEHDRPQFQLNILSILNDPDKEEQARALREKLFSSELDGEGLLGEKKDGDREGNVASDNSKQEDRPEESSQNSI